MALLNPFFDLERRKQYFKVLAEYRWQAKIAFTAKVGNSFEAHLVGPIHFPIAFEASTAFSKINYRTCNCFEYKLLTFFFLSRLFNDFLLQFFGLYTHSTYPSLFLLKRCIFSKLSFYVKWFVRNLDSPCYCFLYFYSSHELFHIGKLSHSWNEHCISK